MNDSTVYTCKGWMVILLVNKFEEDEDDISSSMMIM